MRVREIMTPSPVTLSPKDRLVDADEQMGLRRFRHVPVIDPDGMLMGMLSQVDVIRASLVDGTDRKAVLQRQASILVSDVMSTRLDTVGPEDDLGDVARIMCNKHRSCLPVVDDGKLVGVLTEADCVRLAATTLGADAPWLPALAEAWWKRGGQAVDG